MTTSNYYFLLSQVWIAASFLSDDWKPIALGGTWFAMALVATFVECMRPKWEREAMRRKEGR